jgi:hypothetical protein
MSITRQITLAIRSAEAKDWGNVTIRNAIGWAVIGWRWVRKVVVEGMFLKAKRATTLPLHGRRSLAGKPVQTEDIGLWQPPRSWDEPGFVASSLSLAEAEVAVLSHAWQMTKLF